MPWTWSGQGHKLFPTSSSHLSATLNRCLTSLSHQFPLIMFQFPSQSVFLLVYKNFFMQYNTRLCLVLMRKLLKIQHYQTLSSITLSYSDAKFQSRNNNAIYLYCIYHSSILVLHFLQENANNYPCLQAVNVTRFKEKCFFI